MKKIHVSGEGGSITIVAIGYERPSAENDSDLNWLNCKVNVNIPPFEGEYDASFTTLDFLNFGREIEMLSDLMIGQATFETDERALNFRFTMKARGEIVVEGESVIFMTAQTTLKFCFYIDQSYLYNIKKDISAVLNQFPVRKHH